MTEAEILEYWAIRINEKSCTKESLAGFFQAFRPQGSGLSKVFEGVVGGEEILKRLIAIYRATESGWEKRDAYFVVRKPAPLSEKTAIQLVNLHLDNFAEIARQIDNGELLQLLCPRPNIEIHQGTTPWPPSDDDPEVLLYEAQGEFIQSLKPLKSSASILSDAVYHIANDYLIRDYVLWPLYESSCPIVEPFGPYFELWKHGAGFRFSQDHINVFVPFLDQ